MNYPKQCQNSAKSCCKNWFDIFLQVTKCLNNNNYRYYYLLFQRQCGYKANVFRFSNKFKIMRCVNLTIYKWSSGHSQCYKNSLGDFVVVVSYGLTDEESTVNPQAVRAMH